VRAVTPGRDCFPGRIRCIDSDGLPLESSPGLHSCGAAPGHLVAPRARAARRAGGLDSDRRICDPYPRDWQGGQDRSGRTDLPAL
jgi:hypothetical protein